MVYRITLTSTATYELDADCYTPEQAKELALEWFANHGEYDIEFETLAPCEVDGNCPYDDGRTCNMCH